ncbi:hypothetical protein AAVH_14944 [Aphelenchoides avenae]|nr:hypothetical protein AAVH_14944 [Aphelenchus avenae]
MRSSKALVCPALVFFALYSSSFLVHVRSDFPLAVGGYGKIFFNQSEPLASARVWIQVDSPYGWTNATFPFPNATDVNVDEKTGSFELEAIVGDARRRDEIKGLRPVFADSVSHVPCWYRELDTAYIYLYKAGRRPSRPFSDNITLRGPTGVPEGVSPGVGADVCFHRQLAVAVEGTVATTEIATFRDDRESSAKVKTSAMTFWVIALAAA